MLARYLPWFIILSVLAEILGTVGGFGSSVFFVPMASYFMDFQTVLSITAFTYNLERGMFGETQGHLWMWATDLSGNWFYRKQAKTRMSIPVLIGNAVDAISKNGIVMMNIGLKGDGTLPEPQAKILQAFGDWIKVNGEGIYETRPWKTYGEGPLKIVTKRTGENLKEYSAKDIRFTSKAESLFVFLLALPTENILIETLKTEGLLDK